MNSAPLLLVLALALAGYQLGIARAAAMTRQRPAGARVRALPAYHGAFVALVMLLPALAFGALWSMVDSALIDSMVLGSLPARYAEGNSTLLLHTIANVGAGLDPGAVDQALRQAAEYSGGLHRLSRNGMLFGLVLLQVGSGLFAVRAISVEFAARERVERMLKWLLLGCASVAVMTTAGILLSVLIEAMRFFGMVSPLEFFFGTEWSPQIALRADQQGSSGRFGALPLFAGTLQISAIALLVAVPIGLMCAIYLSEYAAKPVRRHLKPVLEILAGIPTVVYGFFAALSVAPLMRSLGQWMGIDASSESALAAGTVMGVMIIPFVSSLADDIIHAVPMSLRDGSLALGATRSETIRRVVIPAALPGIVGGVLLAASRAIGETMIVVMAAGLSARLTMNPFDSVTTVTVQIVTLLVGDQEFDSPKTLAAFALGLVLFLVTLGLNVIALHIVRKYREQYE